MSVPSPPPQTVSAGSGRTAAGGALPAEAGAVEAPASFASVLDGCRRLFPPALLASAGWERVRDRAGRLPRAVIDTQFGFEFRLGQPNPAADLAVAVLPDSELAHHYVREGVRAEPDSPAAALGAALQEQAVNPDSYFARSVAGVVLEYDLAEAAGPPAAPPGIFLTPSRDAPAARRGFHEHRDAAGLLAALADAAGWNGHGEYLPMVERTLAALPDTGYLFQAGALPGRSPKAFRLLFKGIAPAQVPALLARLEWAGPTDEAAAVLDAMDDLVTYIAVSIDVTADGVGPRLGLELYRPPKWMAVDRTGWRPFIARLRERDWCLPAKAAGLRNWPGVDRLFTEAGVFVVRQGINHVKIVVERNAAPVAKAYAGMDARPLSMTAQTHGRTGRHGRGRR